MKAIAVFASALGMSIMLVALGVFDPSQAAKPHRFVRVSYDSLSDGGGDYVEVVKDTASGRCMAIRHSYRASSPLGDVVCP